MIYLLLSFICVSLASLCNAIMDTLDHHHSISIFTKMKNPLWWNSDKGWRNKYVDRDPNKGRVKWFLGINKPVQITDAWHFFKMLLIIFMCTGIVLSTKAPFYDDAPLYYYLILLLGLGITWNMTFSLFYEKLLLK